MKNSGQLCGQPTPMARQAKKYERSRVWFLSGMPRAEVLVPVPVRRKVIGALGPRRDRDIKGFAPR